MTILGSIESTTEESFTVQLKKPMSIKYLFIRAKNGKQGDGHLAARHVLYPFNCIAIAINATTYSRSRRRRKICILDDNSESHLPPE